MFVVATCRCEVEEMECTLARTYAGGGRLAGQAGSDAVTRAPVVQAGLDHLHAFGDRLYVFLGLEPEHRYGRGPGIRDGGGGGGGE